jgi:hypothetical protein
MSDPQGLRDKAAQCRRLARKPRKGFPQAGGHNYLLDLADRFDQEATVLEHRMAGGKPGAAAGEERPGARSENAAPAGDLPPRGTAGPSRAS